MRWRQRTDAARRTKGDPPLTYAQLEAKAQAFLESGENLRKQVDNLIVENARLRQVVGEKTEYAEELAAELAKATSSWRLGYAESLSMAEALLAGGAKFWSCGTEGHTKVEWRGNVAHCADCGRSSADVVDEDVTRPYISKPDDDLPEWERQFLEDPGGFRKTYGAQP